MLFIVFFDHRFFFCVFLFKEIINKLNGKTNCIIKIVKKIIKNKTVFKIPMECNYKKFKNILDAEEFQKISNKKSHEQKN